MTKRNQDVKVYRANTVTIAVAVTQADGTPYDPTLGARIRYRVAPTSHATEDESVIQKSLGDGIANVTGGVTVTLDIEDTDLDPGIYYHELKVWDGNDASTAMYGAFVVKPSVQMGDRVAPSQGNLAVSGSIPVRTP